MSAKPPTTTYSSTPPEWVTDRMPGRSVVIVGAWSAIAVMSPSAPGMRTSVNLERREATFRADEIELHRFCHEASGCSRFAGTGRR
jgi:hypothetical protein